MKTVNPYPERTIYKFLDEATNLFWNGNLKKGSPSYFNEIGIEYRSAKVAEEAFRAYEITRLGVFRNEAASGCHGGLQGRICRDRPPAFHGDAARHALDRLWDKVRQEP